MPGTTLILPDSNAPLLLPQPQGNAAAEVFKHAEKLPLWLPDTSTSRQWMMAAVAEVNQRSLQDCTPASLVRATFNGAVLGLIFGPQLGHAHIVPFKNKKRNNKEATLIVGYKGYLELAYGSGFLKDVQCEVVLQGEECRRWNDETGARIEHKMDFNRSPIWDKVQAAYCIWHGVAGGRGIAVVSKQELSKLKSRGNVWNTDTIPMCLKTPLRRAANTWKVTGRMSQAMYLDNQHDAGNTQPALEQFGRDVIDAEPPRPKLADMAPATDARSMANNVLTGAAAANVAASAPVEKSPEAVADAALLLDGYLSEFTRAASQGIQAAVDDVVDKALADDGLDPKAKEQCEKWAAEARQQVQTTRT